MATQVMVIGGGPAGLRAAKSLADFGMDVILVEQNGYLGGAVATHQYQVLMPDFSSGPELIKELSDAVNKNDRVTVALNTQVGDVRERGQGFQVELSGGTKKNAEVSAVVLATGFDHFDPRKDPKYGYGLFPDVVTGAELEEMLAKGPVKRPSNGETPKSVAFIYCVGSRDRHVGHTYCSRVCCAVSTKQGIELRHQLPDAKIAMFYMDVRTYGLWEDTLYWRAQEDEGVIYVKGRIAEITQQKGTPVLKGEDTLVRGPFEWPFDLVVLAAGMEPSAGTKAMAAKFGVDLEEHGFVKRTGSIASSALTSKPGVFVAGAASGPKAIEDSITEGDAAAAEAFRYLKSRVLA